MGKRAALVLITAAAFCGGPPLRGELADRIVAVVGSSVMAGGAATGVSRTGFGAGGGGQAAATVISWSAVFDEANYQAFRQNDGPVAWKPEDEVSAPAFQAVLQKMIDQTLLEQELKRSPFAPANGAEAEDQILLVQRKYPNPEAYREALARYQLTEETVTERLNRENILFAFVDATLRPQVHITDEQLESYYNIRLLPELQKETNGESRPVPKLEDVRSRLEELLTQREIDSLLDDWLKQLHRGARIEIWPQ